MPMSRKFGMCMSRDRFTAYCCVFFLLTVFFGKKSGMLISGTLKSGMLMSGMLKSGTLISGKSGKSSRDRFLRDADIADPATVEV